MAIQTVPYPSNSPPIKPISLLFRGKTVVWDFIKGLTEVQVDIPRQYQEILVLCLLLRPTSIINNRGIQKTASDFTINVNLFTY